MVKCYYIHFQADRQYQLTSIKKFLSQSTIENASAYISMLDESNYLAGRYLIQKAIDDFGLSYEIENLRTSPYGKPFFDHQFNFSISHSNEVTAVTFGMHVSVGLDVQYKSPVDWRDFQSVLNETDKSLIRNSKNGLDSFYKIWTQKESIVKADGRGMSLDLKSVHIDGDRGYIQGDNEEKRVWQTKRIDLKDNYETCITANDLPSAIDIVKVDI